MFAYHLAVEMRTVSMNSYSQNSEDLFILNYFGNHKGTLCEIGANDGVTLSNSKLLIEHGWSAHLVEPGMVCDRIKRMYADNENVTTHYLAIGDKNTTMILAESGEHVIGGNDQGLVSSLMPSETERWRDKGVEFMDTEVNVYDWKTFKDSIGGIPFDFISIDAEGYDSIILQQIDLTLTSCVCIEWNGDYSLMDVFVKYCSRFGLRLVHTNNENLIFTR